MKKSISTFIVFFLILSTIFPLTTQAKNIIQNDTIDIFSLNNSECIEFLENNGLVIANEYLESDFTKLFKYIASNPEGYLLINDYNASYFIKEVIDIIYPYIIISKNTSTSRATTVDSLKYSTLYSWNANTMTKYNCYAYAIGKTDCWCLPGQFSNQIYGTGTMSISKLAEMVQADLTKGLGYNCSKIQTSRPSSKGTWVNVIAIRKELNSTTGVTKDFHVAKISGSVWLHKPGSTAILKFNSVPSNSINWIAEGYNGKTYILDQNIYNSQIMYISYKQNHSLDWYITSTNYHEGIFHYYKWDYKCKDCGTILESEYRKEICAGPPCQAQFNSYVEVLE